MATGSTWKFSVIEIRHTITVHWYCKGHPMESSNRGLFLFSLFWEKYFLWNHVNILGLERLCVFWGRNIEAVYHFSELKGFSFALHKVIIFPWSFIQKRKEKNQLMKDDIMLKREWMKEVFQKKKLNEDLKNK